MQEILDQVYYNNTVRDYLIVVSIIACSVVLLKLFKRFIIQRLRKKAAETEGIIDDFIVEGAERFLLPILQFGVIYWGLNFLDLSGRAERTIDIATSVVITYYVIRLVSSVILTVLESRIRRQQKGEEKIKQLGGLMLVINIFIWTIGIVFLLDNMGKDATTIITGLGIGGIAIALAAQNILGDLFNYFVIYFDRPFEVGDFIVVDDKMGTVEYVGIKTTRIRCLTGEQLVIGNSNLTGSRIHNFKRLEERRVVFTINVDYRMPPEKLRIIPPLIRGIIEGQKTVRFDRSHFAAFGDWSLRFETVYYVLDPDYNRYMDIQQQINLQVVSKLKDSDIYMVTAVHMQLAPPPLSPPEEKVIKLKDEGSPADLADRRR